MKSFFTLISCAIALGANAQNVGIGTRKPLSKLHVAGDLRVDSLATAKGTGLVLHNQFGVLRSLKLSDNKSDVLRGDGSFGAALADNAWLLTGNAGTDPETNFIGTIDDKPLHFRVFNVPAGLLGGAFGNTSFGRIALGELTDGQNNTAFGDFALAANTIGNNNTSFGSATMSRNTVGINNTAVGTAVLSNLDGSFNTSVGAFSLANMERGQSNVAMGFNTLRLLKEGSGNVAIGAISQYNMNDGGGNVSIGYGSLFSATSVYETVAIGISALFSNTSGVGNQGVGAFALYYNSTGSSNTAEGNSSLYANTTGSFNTALGYRALYNNTIASRNTAIGHEAMFANTVGASNVALGHRSMFNNKYGHSTISIGDSSLLNNYSGNYNTAIGERVMIRNTSGNGNTALGYMALSFNSTGANNTAIGNGADVTGQTFTNATAIGYNAKVNASNKVRIGNASVTKIEGQVPFTTPSDGRYKYNVRENVSGLDFILRLRPVTYQFDVKRFDGVTSEAFSSMATQAAYTRAEAMRRTGFIAQEVEKAAVDANYDFSGISSPENKQEHYSLSYESFVVPLVKAVQEQQLMISEQKKSTTDYEQRIRTLEDKIEAQKKQIDLLISQLRENARDTDAR